MTLYDTGEDYTYTLSVIKTGSDPTLTANAQINVLSQEEVDQLYSNPEAVTIRYFLKKVFLWRLLTWYLHLKIIQDR